MSDERILTPEATSSDEAFPCLGRLGLLGLLSGIELRPPLPRAVPMTHCADGFRYLFGLRFETVAEAEQCADGLAAFCDRDGERLFLKKTAAINADFSGVN